MTQRPSTLPFEAAAPATEPVLMLEGISKTFTGLSGHKVHALKPLTLSVAKGEILAVVGESGSGKSTLARVALGLLPTDSGRILINGKDPKRLPAREARHLRTIVQPVFQDPAASLNPRRRVRALLHQAAWAYDGDREAFALELLQGVGLRPPGDFMTRYPHQLSGGQKQRLAIARALALRPELIIADEPLSGADVSIRGQVLNLLMEIRDQRHISYIMITHDISIARYFADRIAVMRLGEVVEYGPAAEVGHYPRHAYTQKLLNSIMPVRRPPGGIAKAQEI